MIILIALLFIILAGVIIYIRDKDNLIATWFLVFGIGLLICILIAFNNYYHKCKDEILIFEQTRIAYEKATANGDNIVEVFQAKESNEWLREQQHWNKTIFGIAIPDEVIQNIRPRNFRRTFYCIEQEVYK